MVEPEPLPNRVAALDHGVERAHRGPVAVGELAAHVDDEVTVTLIKGLHVFPLASGAPSGAAFPLCVSLASGALLRCFARLARLRGAFKALPSLVARSSLLSPGSAAPLWLARGLLSPGGAAPLWLARGLVRR